MVIPRIIHQIWIGPHKKPSFMKKWKGMNPDFEYILWDEFKIQDELFPLLNQHLYDQYDNEKINVWNGKANLLRYEILQRFGGIYIDADCNPLKPLGNSLLSHKFFTCYASDQYRPGLVNNAVIGVVPGNEIIGKCLYRLHEHKTIKQPSHIFSGPRFFTGVINQMKKHHDIKIYPSIYFYPEFHNESKLKNSEKSYCSHKWGTTKGLNGKM